ncbi:right-handed parallel beta-helix repeat-containing protein [Methanoculleus taiwanensis]|uniref:right-handed parallel beta-helix repeat-containing protein n=1 Tax=Methanoculleus taiwanensis TaxID=1550565 RepID=UPI0013E8A5E4|nr:right-handed parallel beta-helix repeat-containing protein [Methanoculleus taiwanensis]
MHAKKVVLIALILIGAVLVVQSALTLATATSRAAAPESAFVSADQEKAFGAESNPTSNPIGGGDGYGEIITPIDPQVNSTVTTRDELLTALRNADSGDVIYIDGNAVIDLTDTPTVTIPSGVTLASNRGAENGAGSTIYSFTIEEPGEYTLWGLVSAPDENDNSFWVRMNSEETRRWDMEPGFDWHWIREGTHNLSAGQQTLTVQWREDGAKLDQILITAVPTYVPETNVETQNEAGDIRIEAESGTLSPPMEREPDPTASGGAYITVPEGTGMGDPPISPGGRISVEAADPQHPVALIAGGEQVRITGLRIEGPDTTIEGIGHPAYGIYSAYRNLEVDNCELFSWSGAAISIYRTAGVSDMKTGGYVHHNYIHHCQMSGLGYGVEVGQGGVCLIEANTFDYCRHAIAGTGHVDNGYEVRYNLFGPNFPASNNAHVVDMHGIATASGNVAGNKLIIHNNTFKAISTTSYCIAVRGIPKSGAYIDYNWIEYTGAPIGRTGVTSDQINTRMYIGANKGPSGEILTTLQQRIISTSLV